MLTLRQKSILDLLQDGSPANVGDLAVRLGVSEATIRRDLASLESKGLINRTWGGAMPVPGVAFESFVHERSSRYLPEKRAIAKAAVELIEEGDVIALDVGSTCLEVAKLLGAFRRITVFTNSLLAAQTLAEFNFTVHLVGGRLRTGEFSMVGPIARETALRFHYDKFFIGVAGFHLEHGPTDFNLDDVEVKQSFLGRAKRRIALVDHSKFGQVSLAAICGVSDLTDVVTDDSVSSSHVTSLEQQGIKVTIGRVVNPAPV
ncbi:MAG: DeoR/GlpR family DNA-binding transcription regulator [Alicyclobacillus sp.]|nr:DeoR/GlpR family DNA-binding transcription regulator [Alicyclobacillus sp.]